MLPMARIHSAIFATAVVLLVGGQCSNSNAAPMTMTEAEVFWRSFLPDSPLPDAILELLHPETSSYVNEDDKSDAQGLHEDYPFFYFRYGERDDKHSSLIRRRSHDDSTATHHLSHGLSSFFHEEALRVGENMTLYFPPAASAPLGLLPRRVADSIPLSASSLPSALAQLGIAMDSAQAADMEQTLRKCESPILTGETKFCATSLEALVEGAMAVLGTRNIWPVTSSLPRSGAPRQPYTIRGVHQVDGSSFVSCHDTYYAYTVYMCHGGTGSTAATRTYMVDMEGINNSGTAITVAAVCHTDTSQWDPEHISFKLLGTKPGDAPICHFMPYGHMIWVKQANRSSF